ncbi:MAG: class I SAM-dependent methyltransferase [Symploca sp. SIO2G7]|nr:class I SAM-dependent methyltransferase [Symploca sp. SIO2G7]
MQYPEDFHQDTASYIWLPHQKQFAFQYSDGGEAEAYLENCLKQASDLSCHSVELTSLIRDWPSEYHFSPKRSNLLRPLRLNHCRTVLELGAGCGAITRYLGENIPKVVAVEGSRERARLAALRCRDLANVEIVCGQFQEIQFSEKFDIVTLIGVLEYSESYIKSVNPYQTALEIAKQNLAANGILIVAIENKLGLKYFAGCSEDHTRILFDGIEGYNSGQLVRTFGKQELELLLESSGLGYCHFLYPFPDYKLPDVLLTLPAEPPHQIEPFLYQWLGYDNSRDYSHQPLELFQELLVAKQIEANGFLPQMSNSFLILASQSPESINQYLNSSCLVWKFSVMNRLTKFMSQITLTKDEEQELIVTKEPIYPELAALATETEEGLKHYPKIQSKFLTGVTLMEQLVQAIRNKTSTVEASLKYPLKTWYDFLVQEANRTIGSATEIPGIYIDCGPGNLIVTTAGKLEYVDQEWSFTEKLPIKFVLFRCLIYTYQKIYPWIDLHLDTLLSAKSLQSFILFCFHLISLDITPEEFRDFLAKEWIFQKQVNPLLENLSFDDYVSGVYSKTESLQVAKAPYRLWFQLYNTREELLQTQANLERSQTQLQQTQSQLQQTQSQLQQTQSQLQQTQSQLQQTQSQLQQTQSQLQQTQSQLQQAQATITGMESSKFWKLRKGWFRLKQSLGLKGDD